METVRRANINDLQLGAVLLVDTQTEHFKMIIEETSGTLNGRWVLVSVFDEEENETVKGLFLISQLCINKPITGIQYPSNNENGILEIGKGFTSTPVTLIEIYQDKELSS